MTQFLSLYILFKVLSHPFSYAGSDFYSHFTKEIMIQNDLGTFQASHQSPETPD